MIEASGMQRPMRGPVAFLIALVTGGAGCLLAFLVGDYLTRLYHVSDMEGGRAYAVVFLCAPAGFIAGFVTGLVVALKSPWPRFSGFLKTQGLSIVMIAGMGAAITGLFWIAADKPPRLDGKNLTLDFELRVPPAIKFPAEPTGSSIHASLYANDRDNRLAFIDFKSIRQENGAIIVPGTAALMSQSSNRSLLASIEGQGGASQFIPLKLRPAPRREDLAWSEWISATQRADLSPVAESERMALRYRVRLVDHE
jgi:MFS family permease